MFKFVSGKTYERLLKQNRDLADKVEAGRALADLVDSSFHAMDRSGNSGPDRNQKETAEVWKIFHILEQKLYSYK